jgi:hypothetical protein
VADLMSGDCVGDLDCMMRAFALAAPVFSHGDSPSLSRLWCGFAADELAQ